MSAQYQFRFRTPARRKLPVAPLEISLDRYLARLTKSGLMLDREVANLAHKQKGASLSDINVRSFGEWAIQLELITRWQHECLMSGSRREFHIGRYKLLDTLGAGGICEAFVAADLVDHERVVIRMILPELVDDEVVVKRFHKQAEMTPPNHPNLLQVYHSAQETTPSGRVHYAVSEFAPGQNLKQFVQQRGPLSYRDTAKYICQVARGLQHIHSHGYVHRNVKPSSLWCDPRGKVKIQNLGVALDLSQPDDQSLTLCCGDNMIGTADYMPPEQVMSGHSADPRSDLYGLGCTMYFLLVGQPPFPTGTRIERILKHLNEKPRAVADFRPDVPAELEWLCHKLMAKKREGRLTTAGEVASLLDGWLAQSSVSAVDNFLEELHAAPDVDPAQETRTDDVPSVLDEDHAPPAWGFEMDPSSSSFILH